MDSWEAEAETDLVKLEDSELAELEVLHEFLPDLKPVLGQCVEMQESEPCWRCWADSMGPRYTAQ